MIRSHVPYINKSFVFATLFRIGRLMTLTMFILCSGLLILLTTTFNTYESSAQDPINVPIDNPINVPLPNPGDDNTIITTPADPIKGPAPPIESDPAPPIETDPIESDPIDSETDPIESDPIDSETDPIDSETDPIDSETDPIDSETDPIESETDPIESETDPIESDPIDSETEPEVTNVPTLSEWGLIAMAGILGIVGFMVIRRRKASA